MQSAKPVEKEILNSQPWINTNISDKDFLASAKHAAVCLQSWWRASILSNQFRRYRYMAIKVQAYWRRMRLFCRVKGWRVAALTLSRCFRGYIFRKYGERSPRARPLEGVMRGMLSTLSGAAVQIQTKYRGWIVSRIFKDLLNSALVVQCCWRGFKSRCWFSEKLQNEIYPIIETWNHKIGLWNRLISRVHVSIRMKARITLINGSPTDAITKLITKKFVQDAFSYVIIVNQMPQEKGNRIAEELSVFGPGKVGFFQCNVNNLGATKKVVQLVEARYGKIDCYIINGASSENEKEDSIHNAWPCTDAIIGHIAVFKTILPAMHSAHGLVICISPYESIGSKLSISNAAVKAGFVALMNEVSRAYHSMQGIVICPIIVDIVGAKPVDDGIADLTHYLTSIEAPFLSGEVLHVRGKAATHRILQWKDRSEMNEASNNISIKYPRETFLEEATNADVQDNTHKRAIRQAPKVLFKNLREEQQRLAAENQKLKDEIKRMKRKSSNTHIGKKNK